MSKLDIKFERLTPFKRCVLQNFPFIEEDFDALTNYGLLCKVVAYLNKVIDSQNEVQGVTEEIVTAFNNLYDYVKNFFDNLDVQEEIDNKLDEMAEDGSLADIISQYLNSTAVFGYDTVADMIAAENLVDGSYAQTTGYASRNDGNGAWYKIREITNDDVIDGNFIIEMSTSNQLVAEKIVSNYDKHNVLNYGADPTGTNDSASAINACIQANKGGTISFAEGVFKVQSAINLPFADNEKVSINGNGAKIITTATIDSLFVGGADRALTTDVNNVGFMSYIKDLNIDCSAGSVTNAFYNMQGFKDWHIINCKTYRTLNGIKIGDTTASPADVLMQDCILYGNGSEYDGVGVIGNATDNYIIGCRIYGFRKGFVVKGAVVADACHVLLRWHDQTQTNFNPYPIDGEDFATYYPLTMFADIQADFRVSNSYADSVYLMAYINTTGVVTFDNCRYFNARTGVEQHCFDCTKRDPKLTITDFNAQFRDGDGKSATGLRCINATPSFTRYAQISLKGITITGPTNMTEPFDLITNGYENKTTNRISMLADTWYIAGAIGNWVNGQSTTVNVMIDAWVYTFRISDASIAEYHAGSNTTRYTIGTLTLNGVKLICIKTNEAGNHYINMEEEMPIEYNIPVLPVKNEGPANTTRLLSSYTEDEPATGHTVHEATGIYTTNI